MHMGLLRSAPPPDSILIPMDTPRLRGYIFTDRRSVVMRGKFPFVWRGEVTAVDAQEMRPWPMRVRRTVWLLLASALLLAGLVPAVSFWHASASELAARGCLWPTAPTAGQQARLYIVLDDTTDRAAVEGPWSRIVARWDMSGMHMGPRKVEMTGSHGGSGYFALPLHLDMAGPWWVEASLQAPGRPTWHATYHFDVLPQPGSFASQAPPATPAPSENPCGLSEREQRL
jgi:hypothetical protein